MRHLLSSESTHFDAHFMAFRYAYIFEFSNFTPLKQNNTILYKMP